MAYRKKTYKRTYKKRVSKKPLKKMVRSMILNAQETKELTYPYTNVGSVNFQSFGYGSSTCVAGLFGAVAQGVGDGQRIGNALYARGVNVHFAIQNANSTTSDEYYNNCRAILFQPKVQMATNIQPSVVSTFVQSVLSNTPSGGTQWLSPVDTDRFQVLYDKTWYIPSRPKDGQGTSIFPTTRFFKKFFKINRKIQWDDSGVVNNDVYLMLISDSALTPNPGVVAGFVRVYYKDA